jgi:hypothetical protein
VGWFLVMALFVAQMLEYSARQPRIQIGGGRGDDGVTYGAVADAFADGRHVEGAAPFVYRVAAPWLAARYSAIRGISTDRAFQETDALLTIGVLTTIYIVALQLWNVLTAVLSVSLFSLPWWSYTRLVWFCPVQVDLPWLLAMLLGLALIARTSTRIRAPDVVGLVALSIIASLSRETGLLLPAVWVAARAWRCFRAATKPKLDDIVVGAAMTAGSLAGLAVTRLIAQNTHAFGVGGEPFTFAAAAVESLRMNTPEHVFWSALLAWGGPLLGVFFAAPRSTARLLDERPELFAFWVAVFLLALVGGVNTIRFLSWASPVVFILMSAAVRRIWLERAVAGAALALHLAFLFAGAVVYLGMIHPFGGYYPDYTAWNAWGGLQSSPARGFDLVPCLLIGAGIALSGQLVTMGSLFSTTNEGTKQENPPPA